MVIEFSNYKFTINFIEKETSRVLLSIDTNEKYIYDMVMNLYQYNLYSSYEMSNERVWFNIDPYHNRFIFELSSIYSESPTELEYSNFIVYQYNTESDTVLTRLILIIDEFQIEDFLLTAWKTIQDLDYLSSIGKSELKEYIEFLNYDPKLNLED